MAKKRRRKPPPPPPRRLHRRLGMALGGLTGLLLIVVVLLIVNTLAQPAGTTSTNASPTPTAAPLAGLDSEATGQLVDGISCQTSEQLVYHIHAHLAVFVNGSPRSIPAGIGVAPPIQIQQTAAGPFVVGGRCFYWLHSHTQDGIIHVESPTTQVYTLGNYFDIWGQPLSSTQVGPSRGALTAYVDGQPFRGDPRSIPLAPHTLIQLDVGGATPAPQPFTFPAGY